MQVEDKKLEELKVLLLRISNEVKNLEDCKKTKFQQMEMELDTAVTTITGWITLKDQAEFKSKCHFIFGKKEVRSANGKKMVFIPTAVASALVTGFSKRPMNFSIKGVKTQEDVNRAIEKILNGEYK